MANPPPLPPIDVEGDEAPASYFNKKFDSGKLRYSLLPAGTVDAVLRVLEFGATKYAPDSWQSVPNARQRYSDALMRHMSAWHGGENIDVETGLHHLAHVLCNASFLLWLETRAGKVP